MTRAEWRCNSCRIGAKRLRMTCRGCGRLVCWHYGGGKSRCVCVMFKDGPVPVPAAQG